MRCARAKREHPPRYPTPSSQRSGMPSAVSERTNFYAHLLPESQKNKDKLITRAAYIPPTYQLSKRYPLQIADRPRRRSFRISTHSPYSQITSGYYLGLFRAYAFVRARALCIWYLENWPLNLAKLDRRRSNAALDRHITGPLLTFIQTSECYTGPKLERSGDMGIWA